MAGHRSYKVLSESARVCLDLNLGFSFSPFYTTDHPRLQLLTLPFNLPLPAFTFNHFIPPGSFFFIFYFMDKHVSPVPLQHKCCSFLTLNRKTSAGLWAVVHEEDVLLSSVGSGQGLGYLLTDLAYSWHLIQVIFLKTAHVHFKVAVNYFIYSDLTAQKSTHNFTMASFSCGICFQCLLHVCVLCCEPRGCFDSLNREGEPFNAEIVTL